MKPTHPYSCLCLSNCFNRKPSLRTAPPNPLDFLLATAASAILCSSLKAVSNKKRLNGVSPPSVIVGVSLPAHQQGGVL